MSNSEHLDEPPIAPIYRQSAVNEPIEFGEHEILIPTDEGEGARLTRARVRLRFVPSTLLEFDVPVPSDESFVAALKSTFSSESRKTIEIEFPQFGTKGDAFLKSRSGDRLVYVPSNSTVQLHPPSQSISKAVFHLVNWPDFLGSQDRTISVPNGQRPEATTCRQPACEADGWKLMVAATDDTDAAVKELRRTGGYLITHVGSIERCDQSEFSSEQLDDLLTCMQYLFSFMLGCWNSPCFCVGFDASGTRVYEEYGQRHISEGPWKPFQSCFDSLHPEMLPAVFPGFYNLWNNGVWHNRMKECIYWYVAANRVSSEIGVDSALLFTQAALELLSWTYCVLDRGMLSRDAFSVRGLGAADKLRLLASSLELPLEIPPSMTALHAKRGRKWSDSMDAITDLRNGIVHPSKEQDLPDGAYYAAWRLSLWYIELVLLRLCGYNGNYPNRLSQRWVGQVEPVPWQTDEFDDSEQGNAER